MNPKTLILDEPTAGLDPVGRDEILSQIKRIHTKNHTTVILVTHSMEDIVKIADSIIVMANGEVKMHDSVDNVFSNPDFLIKIGLNVPQINMVVNSLREKGIDLGKNIYTISDAASAIQNYLRGIGKC